MQHHMCCPDAIKAFVTSWMESPKWPGTAANYQQLYEQNNGNNRSVELNCGARRDDYSFEPQFQSILLRAQVQESVNENYISTG